MPSPSFLSFIFLSLLLTTSADPTFTLSNNCPHIIWPGTLSGSGTAQLPWTGFKLDLGHSVRIPAPPGWSGRMWARTGCKFNELGVGTCKTGDCGGKMRCNGKGAEPPTTLFEITLGKGKDQDFYDVSLVDGYNLPIYAAPSEHQGSCNATGCAYDLNSSCPRELQVEEENGVVACKSACEAFGLDQYCCSGKYANPTTCKPSFYSAIFKRACPRAYSYAFDDGTSTFTCKATDYTVVFCPAFNRTKRVNGYSNMLPPPSSNNGQPVSYSNGQPNTHYKGQPSYWRGNEGEDGDISSYASSIAYHALFAGFLSFLCASVAMM